MVAEINQNVHTYTTDQQQLPALVKGSPNQRVRPNVAIVVHLVAAVTRLVVRDLDRDDLRVIVAIDRATVVVLHVRPHLPDQPINRNRARPQSVVYVHHGQAPLPVDPLENNRSDSRIRSGVST